MAVGPPKSHHSPLKLDPLCEKALLGTLERLIVLAAALPGLGQTYTEDVLGNVVSFYGAASVENLCVLLDPKTVDDWICARRLFEEDNPLRRSSVLDVGEQSSAGPDTLMRSDASVDLDAWHNLFAEEEPNETEYDDEDYGIQAEDPD